MPNNVIESFNMFKSNLEITALQKSTVSGRQQNIRDALQDHLEVTDTFLTGSYSRHTMIAPLKEADIDIFIILDRKYFYHYDGKNGGPAGLLELLKSSLKRTYSRTPDISRNGQAVTITFSDFIVDVVPAFNRKGGGFLIPNSQTQSWLSTDPKKHVEIWSQENQLHNGNLVPLIKMIKRWNKMIKNFFMSFHIEVMVLQILHNVTITDFPSGVRYFFDKGRYHVSKENPDPAQYGKDVGSYINTQSKINDSVNLFQLAYDSALKAEEYARNNKNYDAINMWRLVFGDFFPAFG